MTGTNPGTMPFTGAAGSRKRCRTGGRWIAWLVAGAFLAVPLSTAAQTFGGELSLPVTVLPGSGTPAERFDSPLNPGNVLGLPDLSFAPSIRLELLSSSGGSDMEFVTRVSQPGGLTVLRANARLFLGDRGSLRVGRFSAATGYGFGWNPTDFWSPRPDPMALTDEVPGIDGVELSLAPVNALDVSVLGIYPTGAGPAGTGFTDLQAGGEMTLYLPGFEARLTGLYEYDDSAGEDAAAPGVGVGAKLDLFGMGIYGEAALLESTRQLTPDASLDFTRPDGAVLNALAGIEYHFADGTSLVGEYFFNGEGYDLAERERYRDALVAAVVPDPGLVSVFRPGSFARHYVLASLSVPVLDQDALIEAGATWSPDSRALSALASGSYYVTETLTVELSYAGLFSLADGYVSEADLSPVRHTVMIEARYLF